MPHPEQIASSETTIKRVDDARKLGGTHMFYRVTKYNFDDERFDDILAWGETVRAKIEGIDGILYVDAYRSVPGEGMIVAAYESESAFNAASATVSEVLSGMGQFMSGAPHTHSGTVEMSFGR
jgi:hypothetical protein